MRNQKERALALLGVYAVAGLVFVTSPGIWIHAASEPLFRLWEFPEWLGGPRMQKTIVMVVSIAFPAIAFVSTFLILKNADSDDDDMRKEAEKGIRNSLVLFWMMTVTASLVMAMHLWRAL
ncbi:MAG: hypothetical protein B7Y90_10145 [Alphaproteobacteria bacterium 32-64-14]|nr:MAG: hypothetical protein B7Y90_10145 [Alphaproteobacteria bacterium 32-64-14]